MSPALYPETESKDAPETKTLSPSSPPTPNSSIKSKMERNSPLVLLLIYSDYDGRKFYIGSFKGNAYEMGLAYGTLFKDELKVMQKDFF